MKKSDIAMLILIASVAIMVAFTVGNSLPFLKVDTKGVKVKTIEKVSSDVTEPNSEVFDSQAINPTVKTLIGGR